MFALRVTGDMSRTYGVLQQSRPRSRLVRLVKMRRCLLLAKGIVLFDGELPEGHLTEPPTSVN